MSAWAWIIAACVVAYLTKLVGYLLPTRWLEGPRVSAIFSAMTIGLLGALVALNAVGNGRHLVLDARLVALAAAAVALRLKAPYLVVVIVGAAAAALARLAGMP